MGRVSACDEFSSFPLIMPAPRFLIRRSVGSAPQLGESLLLVWLPPSETAVWTSSASCRGRARLHNWMAAFQSAIRPDMGSPGEALLAPG